MKRTEPPPSKPSPGPPPRPRPVDRPCPATYQNTPPHSFVTYGVQCKYAEGHEGDHAGHKGYGEGDVFWPRVPE